MSRYPRLFEPLQVHGRKLINRVIMGSMHTGLEEGQHHFDHSLRNMAAFYEERARGGVGLIVTGGIAPNNAGRVAPLAAMMTTPSDAMRHREVTEAVHQHRDADGNGPMIAMQILHAGRYGYHPFNVSPSKAKAPIGWFTPKPLSEREIERTIDDFVRAAALAEEAGYDGVEVMGSEGYLINQFLAKQVNDRTDAWGGAFDNRMRLALRIVEGIRAATTPDFIVIFRLSMLDLVEQGSDWAEVVALAQALEAAGASIINTGIGWHEARIPTIATCVPRAGTVKVVVLAVPQRATTGSDDCIGRLEAALHAREKKARHLRSHRHAVAVAPAVARVAISRRVCTRAMTGAPGSRG